MTNADDTLHPDDARAPIEHPRPDETDRHEHAEPPDPAADGEEASLAPSDEGSPPEVPSRRDFLAALAGLGLVHFHVLRLGAPVSPTPPPEACGAIIGGNVVQDQGCGVQSPQGPSVDHDCGVIGQSSVSQDNSCGLSVPGVTGHAYDSDCALTAGNTVSRDNLCGLVRNGVTASDRDCGLTAGSGQTVSVDNDCGVTNTLGSAMTDNACGLFPASMDLDCGKPGPDGTYQEDSDCGQQTMAGVYSSDDDCGKAASSGGVWIDNDCGKMSYNPPETWADNNVP